MDDTKPKVCLDHPWSCWWKVIIEVIEIPWQLTIYLKAWFTASLAACTLHSDLQLLKDLQSYQDIHTDISKATSAKLGNHLWYLSDELVGLAFFDRNIVADTKRKMVKSLQDTEGDDEPLKRIKVASGLVQKSELQDFVSQLYPWIL